MDQIAVKKAQNPQHFYKFSNKYFLIGKILNLDLYMKKSCDNMNFWGTNYSKNGPKYILFLSRSGYQKVLP